MNDIGSAAFIIDGTKHEKAIPAFNERSASGDTGPAAFFDAKKPLPASERLSVNDYFNPVKRMKEEANEDTIQLTLAELRRFGDLGEREHLCAENVKPGNEK